MRAMDLIGTGMLEKMPEIPSVDSIQYREAMSRVASAVHLITSDGPAGRAGLTATAVTSVSDSPATLLVCLKASSQGADVLCRNGVLAINTLNTCHESLANLFGRSGAEDRFGQGDWLFAASPILRDAAVVFECRISEIKPVATHLVIFAQVLNIRMQQASKALVYYGRNYHSI